MVRRRYTAATIDPEADTTECHECGATIEIEADQEIVAAVVHHYTTAHDLGE
jgi:hypothetical protein